MADDIGRTPLFVRLGRAQGFWLGRLGAAKAWAAVWAGCLPAAHIPLKIYPVCRWRAVGRSADQSRSAAPNRPKPKLPDRRRVEVFSVGLVVGRANVFQGCFWGAKRWGLLRGGWLALFAAGRAYPPAGRGTPLGADKRQGETASLLGWSHGGGYNTTHNNGYHCSAIALATFGKNLDLLCPSWPRLTNCVCCNTQST